MTGGDRLDIRLMVYVKLTLNDITVTSAKSIVISRPIQPPIIVSYPLYEPDKVDYARLNT